MILGKKIKIVSLILVTCLTINLCGGKNVRISAKSDNEESVIVNGIKYTYFFEDNTLKLMCDEADACLELDMNGYAKVEIENENYTVDFEELSEDKLDATVYNEDGKKVDEYDEIEDVMNIDYEPQAAIALVSAICVTTLVEVLVEIAICAVIAGVTCYAVSKVIEQVKEEKKKQKLYYKAYLMDLKESVYIDFRKDAQLSKSEASRRIQQCKNIYTYDRDRAKAAVDGTNMGCIPEPEITSNKNMKKGHLYYYHWHTFGRNGAHAWYGAPHTKK